MEFYIEMVAMHTEFLPGILVSEKNFAQFLPKFKI